MLVQSDWTSQRTTRGGMALEIRSVAPEDRRKVLEFLEATEAPDLRFRFLSAVKASDALASLLTDVDHRSTEDLIALDHKDGSIAATAMIATGNSPDNAEIAILVRSDLKGQGIGWDMLDEACRYAGAKGYREVECIESSSNELAIALEREQGFRSRPHPDDAKTAILVKDLV